MAKKNQSLREKNPPTDDPRQDVVEGDPQETGRGTGGRLMNDSRSRGGKKTRADEPRPRKRR
jgi:hypothetical protein